MIHTASRLAVVAACILTVVVAAYALRHPRIDPTLKPHLALVAAWSAVFAAGMSALLLPADIVPLRWLVPALNSAATMTVGGLALLVARIVRQVPK